MNEKLTSSFRTQLQARGCVLPANSAPLAEGHRTLTFRCCCGSVVELMKHVVRDLPSDRALTPAETMSVMAADPQLRRALCVLKVCKPAMELTGAELETLQSLADPHLIAVCVWDNESSPPLWFASDYFAEGSLYTHLAEYRHEPERAARRLLPLATLLGRMHARGLTHRDVQTKNIFVADDGELVLGEFGAPPARNGLSPTYELARSADYLPRWPAAELNTPARDVYMLARVLSAMVAGGEQSVDLAAPSPAGPSDALVGRLGDSAPMKLVTDFLRAHITETASACQSVNGAELATSIEHLIAGLAALATVPFEVAELRPGRSKLADTSASR